MVGCPSKGDCSYDAGRPRRTLDPSATRRHLDRSPPPQRFERDREGARRRQPGQQCSCPVTQRRDAVPRALACAAPGKMAFDLHALRATQSLIEIGVKLVLRNVPHGYLCWGSAGRELPPVAAVRELAWYRRLQPLSRSELRFPDS